LKKRRQTLESKGFRLSKSKTEYLKCGFSGVGEDDGENKMGGVAISRVHKFKYLGSIMEEKGDIDDSINYCIRVGWQNWQNAFGVLCDKKVPVGLKRKVYCMVVRLTLLYGAERCPIKKIQVQRLMVAEMRMIRWMCSYNRLHRIRNVVIKEKVGVAHRR